MAEEAKRDQNRIPTLLAVSNVDGVTPVRLWADPVTHRLLVDLPGGSGTGDVVGPAGATADNIVLFDGATGKLIKDSTKKLSDYQTVLTNPVTGTGTANEIAYWASSSTIGTLAVATYPSLTELSYVKGVTSSIQTQLNGKQASLGFTAENVANKSTSVSTDGSSDTKYPSVKAVKDYADGLVAGLLDYRGAYNASGNTYPATGGSGTASAILKGDMWVISVAGTLGGTAVQIGDSIIANTDTPGQTAGNWDIFNGNISYVPEDVANKDTTTTLGTSDTKYPSQNAVKVYADTKLAKSTNITAINDTGIADGEIMVANLTNKDIRTSDKTIVTTLGTDDTTVPTSKAVKDVTDAKIPNTLVDAKGDIITATADNTPARLAVGNNNEVLTADSSTATGLKWAAASGGGTSLWTAITATRVSNTTCTVVGDQTAIFKKGMIIRWQESAADKVAMVSIPSTVSTDTTITFIGDTMASIDSNSFKYSVILGAEPYIARFAIAGTIGATATDVANAYYATEPMKVIGADLQVGTAGTTNSTTIDINKAGTTMFTTKPTLATTVASSPTPFTADTTSALALGDKVTIDIDAVQTTAAIDLYAQLYLFPTRFLTLS